MNWLAWLGGVAGSIAAVIGLVRLVIRPTRRALRLLARIGTDLSQVWAIARDLHILAGAVTVFSVAMDGRLRDTEGALTAIEERLDDITALLVDAIADIARIEKGQTTP